MTASYRSRQLAVLRQNEREMTRLFSALAASVAREVTRRANADGIVPKSATYEIQAAVGPRVMSLFLGRNRDGSRAPFTTLRDGSVFPLSPYARVLWAQIRDGVQISVEQQANILQRRLHRAPDVVAALQTARLDPFEEARRASEQIAFRANPLAQYAPPHLWVDPRGYTLSERIWRTAGNTRRRLDLFLEQRIAAGDSALNIARDVETFLLPNRKLKRTRTPYGRDASFDAMRLARTEITRAAAQASETAAALNPFVAGMSVVLSPSHPKYDICDVAAAHGAWPVGEIPAQYQIPLHPHCVTPGQLVQVGDGPKPIEDISVGDYVLSHTGSYKPVTFVCARYYSGNVYEFETRFGKFELTANHPVLLRRGWTKAQDVELGDEILYTTGNIMVNHFASVAKSAPTLFSEICVPSGVVFFIVPIIPVTLNCNLDGNQGEISRIPTYAILALKDDIGFLQSLFHNSLNACGARNTNFSSGLKHRFESRIIFKLGDRDFLSHFRALGGIVVTREIANAVNLGEHLASGFTATPVIMAPTDSYSIASTSHGNVTKEKQLTQHVVGDAILGKDLHAAELLTDINIIKKLSEWATILGFNPKNLPLNYCQSMLEDMSRGETAQSKSANGANNRHSNLLLLLPDSSGGAESGNPVVSRIANPTQAHLHYTTIQIIRQRMYHGFVYNMEVAEDNSYTVNDAVVHNCMCSYRYEMVENSREVLDELRDEIQGTRRLTAMIGPLQMALFVRLLLGGQ